MQKPSRGALEAVYGYVLAVLMPRMLENQGNAEQEKPPASSESKERRFHRGKED
jgi:hypothetical protein